MRFASARPLARPVLALLRRVPERPRWHAGVADGAVIALAAASFAVAVNDPTAPLALLAPGTDRPGRRRADRPRARPVVAPAGPPVRPQGPGHRPARARPAVAAHDRPAGHARGHRRRSRCSRFAATAWDVAAGARADVATDTVGADRVLLVGAADPHSLISAVASAADGQAVAVVRATERYAGGTVELVGVSTQHLADVAVWRGHDQAELSSLATRLHPNGDLPAALPVALAGAAPNDDIDAAQFTFPGLGENAQRFSVVSRSTALPRVGTRALLFDLDYAVRAAEKGSGLSDNTRLRYEVWAVGVGPGRPGRPAGRPGSADPRRAVDHLRAQPAVPGRARPRPRPLPAGRWRGRAARGRHGAADRVRRRRHPPVRAGRPRRRRRPSPHAAGRAAARVRAPARPAVRWSACSPAEPGHC